MKKVKRGDFVVLVRRPAVRGIVIDTWTLPSSPVRRATVIWENGHSSPVNVDRDVLPGEPFWTEKLEAELKEYRARNRKTAKQLQERIVWLNGVLGKRGQP